MGMQWCLSTRWRLERWEGWEGVTKRAVGRRGWGNIAEESVCWRWWVRAGIEGWSGGGGQNVEDERVQDRVEDRVGVQDRRRDCLSLETEVD
eukprot:6210420-Pleurochrysis_carterae.AAC.1